MRRALFVLLVFLLVPSSLFAQHFFDRGPRGSWGRDSAFELTPFGGYRYGGTIYATQTDLFRSDVDVASSGSYGLLLGIPLGSRGMKFELMANRQETEFKAGSGLFEPDRALAGFDITYYHAGVLIPFGDSRTTVPFVVLSAGVANLAPDIAGVSAENRFSASAGIGLKMPVARNVFFRIEARGYYTSLGSTDDGCFRCYYDYNRDLYQGETNVGLSFRF